MFAHTLIAAALAASSALVAAHPARAQQEVAAAPAAIAQAVAAAAAAAFYTIVSPDGSCGGDTSYTCEGSSFGDCCSVYGYW
jgi:hypothetical protein